MDQPDRVEEQEPIRLDTASASIVLIGGGIAALPLMAIASVLPQIGQALAHTRLEAALVRQLIGGVALAMVAGATLVGFLTARFGLRSVLVGAALVYGVAGTAGLYLGDLRSLLASRLLLGLAGATIQVGCMILVNTRLTGNARSRWMGLHIAGAMAATILVHPIAGSLGTLGWRYPFALYALGFLLIPLALALPAAARGSRIAAAEPTRPALGRWFPWRYVLLAFVLGSVVFAPMVHVPYLLRDRGLASPAAIGLVLTADSVAGMILAALFGAARTRLSARQAFMASFAAGAVGLGLAALTSGLPLAIVGLLIYGAGAGWFVPNLMSALAASVAPAVQGRAVGIVKAAHYLAAPLSIALVEPLARSYGTVAALEVAAATCLVMLIILASSDVRRWLGRPEATVAGRHARSGTGRSYRS